MRQTENNERYVGGMPTLGERKIYKFYDWASIIAPIFLMVTHWGIFFVFSRNTQELMQYSKANEVCIIWMYFIMFLFSPMMLIPANYFFRWCSLFRIPFFYFIFISIERLYYGSWFCTNEMVGTHYVLIYCIMAVYAFDLIELYLRHRKVVNRWICNVFRKLKDFFHCDDGLTDEELDRIVDELNKEREEKEKKKMEERNGH